MKQQEEEIDFEELERKAKEEAEEAKKLGYKPQAEPVLEPSPRAPKPVSLLSLGSSSTPEETPSLWRKPRFSSRSWVSA